MRETSRLAIAGLLAAAGWSAWPAAGWADKKIDATKTVTWKLPKVPPPPATNGIYTWNLTAVASDNHGFPPKGDDNPNPPPTWPIATGLAAVTKSSGTAGGPPGQEPDAKADATFQAGAAVPTGAAGGPGTVTASTHLVLNADTVPETNPPTHGKQTAQATAFTSMQVSTGTVTSVEISQPGAATVVINGSFDKGKVGFGANTGSMKLSDPLSITLTDLTLGTSIKQNLFSSDIEGVVNGEWSWGSSGLALDAPLDGVSSVSVSLDFLSSWITDPTLTDSEVSLDNGVFTASGLFAGLPWVVTPTSAQLAPGVLDSIFIPYQIPAGLLDPAHLYDAALIDDASAQVSATAAPEPPGLVLLTPGLVFAFLFRKRALQGIRGAWCPARVLHV